MKATRLPAALLLLLGMGGVCFGVEPEKTEALVYRLDSFAETEYSLAYSPPQAGEICLIAGTDNALDPRYTLVYYWPMSREYFQDWEALDAAAEGRLEVVQDGRIVRSVDRTALAFHHPAGTAQGYSRLLSGGDAAAKLAEFEEANREYQELTVAFSESLIRYRQELREYMQRSRLVRDAGPPPQPPREPEPPDWFVSEPRQAFVLNLPAGTYSIRLRDGGGAIVEGSERKLVAFGPLGGDGTGYEVLPEERWTARLRAETPENGIYCLPGKEVFLIPYRTRSYREDLIVRMKDPQAAGLTGRAATVYLETRNGVRLALSENGRVARRIERADYYVRQAPGAQLGYRIEEYDPGAAGGESASFSAFRLRFEPAEAGRTYEAFLEGEDGAPIPGSGREVRVVGSGASTLLWVVAFLPLLPGVGVVVRRRARAWNPGRDE